MADLPIKLIYDKVEGLTQGDPFYPQTSTDAVMLPSGATLQSYLETLRQDIDTKVETPLTILGRSIIKFESQYCAFAREVTSFNSAMNSSAWEYSVKSVSEDNPNLWGRFRFTYYDQADDETEISDWTYVFCGSLGKDGKNGTSVEQIYKAVNINEDAPTGVNSEYSTNPISDYLSKEDYRPAGWYRSPQNVTKNLVIYIAQRSKKDKLWSRYSEPSIWGASGEDGSCPIIIPVYKVYSEDLGAPELPTINAHLSEPTYSATVLDLNLDWTNDPGEPNDAEVVWVAFGFFGQTSALLKWDGPIRISGPRGKTGIVIETAYTVTENKEVFPDVSKLYALGDDSIDPENNSTGWFITAADCNLNSDDRQCLWMTLRLKGSDGEWKFNKDQSGWSDPVLLSTYGHDAIDGDGLQMIYLRLTEEEYLFIKDYWNFDGITSGDIPSDPVGVERIEPCTATASFDEVKKTLLPTIIYRNDNDKESSGKADVYIDLNFTKDTIVYEGYIPEVIIDDFTYYNFAYKISQNKCPYTKILYINRLEIVRIAESATDNKNESTWGPEEAGKNGVINTMIAYKDYPLSITRNGQPDTDNWNNELMENSDFRKYTPKYTLNSSDVYKITVIIDKTDDSSQSETLEGGE